MRVNRLVLAETFGSLGFPGLLGLSLLAFALAFALSALLPARSSLEQARLDAAAARAEAARPRPPGPPVDTSPAGQLRGFYERFPARPDAPDWLEKVYAVADKEKLQLVRGEYSVAVDAKTDLTKYRILLPVKGSYGQIRNFLSGALQEVPYLALDDADFQRPKAGDQQVDARLRLTLYMVRR